MKSQTTPASASVQIVSPVLTESVALLREAWIRVTEHYDASALHHDCSSDYFHQFDRAINDAAHQLSEMARVEYLEGVFYK